MPSTKLHSDISALVASLPTVKEAQLAKQGLRALRDATQYKHGRPVSLADSQALQELGVTEVLLRWLQSPAGKTALDDFGDSGSEALIKALEVAVEDIDTVRITLAYHPSTDDLIRFHTWFASILNKPVLLDVQYDPSLVAGFTAMAGSKFVDASIKEKLPTLAKQVANNFRKLNESMDGKNKVKESK